MLCADDFTLFAKLREWRKDTALKEAIAVYTIFTNEQLAQIAGKRPKSKAALQEIQGISCPDNLRIAFIKAARGKQDRPEVIRFGNHFEQNIQKLHNQLQANSPEIGKYHFFHVQDPKRRLICAASFPERVLHHAIINICESVFERYAIFDSYACRNGKGLRRAVRKCHYFSRSNPWYLKIDIQKYFDSIDHRIMLDRLSLRFKDKRLLNLFSALLDTYHVSHGKGMPIGNLISQHFANFYLGAMDHWLKEERKIKGYLRYMDDSVLFGADKTSLKNEFYVLQEYLQDHFSLQIKDDWSLNRCSTGIPFLGFHIFPTGIKLGKRSKKRFKEKLRQYEKKYIGGVWSEDELARHITPLIEFTRNADSFAFRQKMLQKYGVMS